MILITGTRSKGFFTEPTTFNHFSDLKIQDIKASLCVYKTEPLSKFRILIVNKASSLLSSFA